MRGQTARGVGATSGVDLAKVGRALARYRWRVIGATLAAAIFALLFAAFVSPLYSAEALLLLERQQRFFADADRGEGADAAAAPDPIGLLRSRELARRAVAALGLRGNPEFDTLAQGMGAFRRMLMLMGIVPDPTLASPEARILEKFWDRLATPSSLDTPALSIRFTSRDPELAARAANVVAEAYIAMRQEARRANAHRTAEALAARISDLPSRAAEAAARVEEFGARRGVNGSIGDPKNQLALARAAQAEAQAKATSLRELLRQGQLDDIPNVVSDARVKRAAERRGAVRAQLALELRTLLSLHPRIKELRTQLAGLDAQLRSVAERMARELDDEARLADARASSLARASEDLSLAAGGDEAHLRELERAAKLLNEQLSLETAKYREALARERLKATPNDARIIRRALAPVMPSLPTTLSITVVAALGAFALAAGAIIRREARGARVAGARAQRGRAGAFSQAESGAGQERAA